MKKILLLTLFTGVFVTLSIAQQKYIDEAMFYFRSENYCEGAAKCELAYKKVSPKSPKAMKIKGQLAFMTAECFRLTEKFSNATDWYDKAIMLKYEKIEPRVFFYNAEMYRAMGDFNPAEENYKEYLKLVPGDRAAKNGIESVQLAKRYQANRTRYTVKNESKLNKPENDMAPMLGDRKGTELYFSSARPGSKGSDKDPRSCESYMDLWVAKIDKKGNFGQPQLIAGENVNTEDHEGTVCFDGRYKTMFFTRCPNVKKQNLGCDIWMSESGPKGWGEPTKLLLKPEGKDGDTVSVGHPCVSEDGRFLIFASDMPGGEGGRDLWYSTYDRRSNSWSTPVNMGPEINTPGNELFPTFGLDGSLYFASDGHLGMGGLDIFKAQRVGEEFKWVKPENMGFPINSVSNDFGLIEVDPRNGYFTSNRKSTDSQGEYTDDIWSYTLPPNKYTLKVIVLESGQKGKRIANANVKVQGSDGATWEGITNDLGEVYFEKKPDDSRYINEETEYGIEASLFGEGDKGYYPNDGGISTVGLDQDYDFILEIELLPKTPIRLPEVRYALARWELLVNEEINSKDSLNFVDDLLKKYPTLVIKLTSHTDSRDTDQRNLILSQKRAEECVKYLVEEKGIDPLRLQAEGRGERQPRTVWLLDGEYIVDEPDENSGAQEIELTEKYINQFMRSDKVLFEKLHQFNRRTEGEIVSFDYVPAPKKEEVESENTEPKQD